MKIGYVGKLLPNGVDHELTDRATLQWFNLKRFNPRMTPADRLRYLMYTNNETTYSA